MARAYIGTSGWVYKSWRQGFYAGIPARAWLGHAANVFGALEINGSFYTQIKAETFTRWREQTPDEFRFALKGHRFITHYKRLIDCDDSVRRLRDPARKLGEKLHAVVWQLPSTMKADVPRLARFMKSLKLWRDVRHAMELRHASWFTDEVARVLEDAEVAVCLSDAPDFPMWRRVTTDLVYVRLHGHTRKYASSYPRPSLSRWAVEIDRWMREGRDVHAYLDNDAEGAAARNAITLREELAALTGAPAPGP
ncbi:MAG TPA: DUF72 domain-containing protein [Kofleriaceae bacterium]|nr:DUF72 domain-containing protein [Kofleriaceae bacterium]